MLLTSVTEKSIQVDTNFADAAKVSPVKSPGEGVQVIAKELIALKRFKYLMTKHAGKLRFAGL